MVIPMLAIDGNAKVIQTKWDNLYFIFFVTHKMHIDLLELGCVELRTFVTILLECFTKNIHFIQWEKN